MNGKLWSPFLVMNSSFKHKTMSGFDPNKSRVSADKLAEFLSSPIVDDITSVPGIGPATAEKLKEDNVETTVQLIGIFFTLKAPGMTQQEHVDAMWYYLQELGVNSFRSGIVQCIAEKANIMIPGIYDGQNN